MLALLSPEDGGPERPLHVLVRENPDVSCTNCVSKGIRCTTNQIVNPAKPNKGGKRIEEAKKMFGSDGFQNAASPPAPAPTRQRHESRRASVSRSSGVSTAGGSSAVSEQSTPGIPLHTFGAHQFNVLGTSSGGHSGPTASFVPPAPIPSPTVHPAAHGWSAPLEDWSGIGFEAHNFGFPHTMHSPPFALDAATWEAAIVVPPAPPLHAHTLPAPPSALNRLGPPPLEAPAHSLSDPVLPSESITPLTASTVSFLPHQPLASSPGVTSDVCLPSHPSSRSDSSNSNPQPRVTSRKRTLADNEEDDVLELVRHAEPMQYDPCYMWAPRDKVNHLSQHENARNGVVSRSLEHTADGHAPHADPTHHRRPF